MPLCPVPTSGRSGSGEIVHLRPRRCAADSAVRAAAQAPVRHITAALLDALHGSWGTPEEVLGRIPPGRRRLAVAR